MSALEELVAAASRDCTGTASVKYLRGCYCTAHVAQKRLAALASDMARAGQALADNTQKYEQVWEEVGACEECFVSFCTNHQIAIGLTRSKALKALDTWNALGDAEEKPQ